MSIYLPTSIGILPSCIPLGISRFIYVIYIYIYIFISFDIDIDISSSLSLLGVLDPDSMNSGVQHGSRKLVKNAKEPAPIDKGCC